MHNLIEIIITLITSKYKIKFQKFDIYTINRLFYFSNKIKILIYKKKFVSEI
jgi:hypothetical protein